MVFGENLSASLHPSGGSNVTMIRPRSQWWWHAQGGIVVVQQIRRALGCDSYLIDDNRWMMDDGMMIDGIYQPWNMFFLKPGPLFFVFFVFWGWKHGCFVGSMKTEVGLVPSRRFLHTDRGPQLSCGRSHCTLRLGCTKTLGHHAPWRGNHNDGGLDFWGFGREGGMFLAREKGG